MKSEKFVPLPNVVNRIAFNWYATKFFQNCGYEIAVGSREVLIPVEKNQPLRCVDDGYTSQFGVGPAIAGALDGVALLEASKYGIANNRTYMRARILVNGTGFQGVVHGDKEHGPAGCKLAQVWMNGVEGWPVVEGINIKNRVGYADGYVELSRRHNPMADLTINLRPHLTRIQASETYHADAWYALSLREVGGTFSWQQYLQLINDTFQAVRPNYRQLTLIR